MPHLLSRAAMMAVLALYALLLFVFLLLALSPEARRELNAISPVLSAVVIPFLVVVLALLTKFVKDRVVLAVVIWGPSMRGYRYGRDYEFWLLRMIASIVIWIGLAMLAIVAIGFLFGVGQRLATGWLAFVGNEPSWFDSAVVAARGFLS